MCFGYGRALPTSHVACSLREKLYQLRLFRANSVSGGYCYTLALLITVLGAMVLQQRTISAGGVYVVVAVGDDAPAIRA